MTSMDLAILIGPFLAFVSVMTILFGIAHFFDIRD